ncbi:hypothetical protein [Psychroflexus sediminis]|nr:hypothetical protein [Psychroflexus sediminis]
MPHVSWFVAAASSTHPSPLIFDKGWWLSLPAKSIQAGDSTIGELRRIE